MRRLTKNFNWWPVSKVGLLVIVSITFIGAGHVVRAINNNNQNIPTWITDDLKNNHAQRTIYNATSVGPGANCDADPNGQGGVFKQGQVSWLSNKGDNDSQEATIKAGTDSIDLWYNAVGFTCDKNVNAEGRITGQTLRETQINPTNWSARVGNKGLTVDPPTGSTARINLDYGVAYQFNQRFVKQGVAGNGLPSEQPPFRDFRVRGLASLAPGTYTINVTVRDFMVNRFQSGSNETYLCVYDVPTRPASGLADRGCEHIDRNLEFDLVVEPRFAGNCTITITNPADRVIVPGQAISGTIRVNNTGVDDWGVAYPADPNSFRLGLSTDNDYWGPNTKRIAIKPSVVGSFGPILKADTSSDTPVNFVAPADLPSGTVTMRYRILQEGVRPYGHCDVTFRVKENRPFIRASGADVISGALFGLGAEGSCSARTSLASAKDAPIVTNGYPAGGLAGFNGFSSSQYATFASGEVGNSLDAGQLNNYAANNGSTVNDGGEQLSDLLFANQNIPGAGKQGRFYGTLDNLVPCIDTSVIQRQLTPAAAGSSFGQLLAASAPFVRHSGNLVIPASNITARKVIWVEGNVTIQGSVGYDQASYKYVNGQPNPPYLMIIATGGIQVERAADRLDGVYVSLPITAQDGGAANPNSGRLDTCSNIAGVAAYTWPPSGTGMTAASCDRKLTLNGSLIARRILWKGTYGTLGQSDAATNPACAVNAVNFGTNPQSALRILNQRLEQCSSEYIATNPEVYFGLMYVEPGSSTGNVPLSSIELPPIY